MKIRGQWADLIRSCGFPTSGPEELVEQPSKCWPLWSGMDVSIEIAINEWSTGTPLAVLSGAEHGHGHKGLVQGNQHVIPPVGVKQD